ncbi:MAG: SIS domain-containing protein [Bacteroidales bacterium]
MNYLNYKEDELKDKGAIFTATEIAGQPDLWKKIYTQFIANETEIKNFLSKSFKEVKRIILTGAGTSAYIGLSLKGVFQKKAGIFTDPIPTTDLVTHPLDYFSQNESTLLVSFARSGNSPESLAAVQLAEKICSKLIHVIITCDANGKLAGFQSGSPKLVIILPPESNDKSLAMTGSYSGMLLAGILLANSNNIKGIGKKLDTLCSYGNKILKEYSAPIELFARKEFKRAVFLGSGPLQGTATESQLKLQELTDGHIICKCDSFLGFRHGPKAVVDENTMVVFIFSNVDYVLNYEKDLVKDMNKGKHPAFLIGVSEKKIEGINPDLEVVLSDSADSLDEELLAVCQVIPAQLLGFFKSLHLGLKPDKPSDSGAISRVVQGVNIYNF